MLASLSSIKRGIPPFLPLLLAVLLLPPTIVTADDSDSHHEHVHVLTGENYHESTSEGKWIVKFYAPWCGHCKRVAPVFDDVAGLFKGRVNFGDVDCTQKESVEICAANDVKGYPTIKYFDGPQTEVFKQARTVQGFTAFLSGMLNPPVAKLDLSEFEKTKKPASTIYILMQAKEDSKAREYMSFAKVAKEMRTSTRFYSTDSEPLIKVLSSGKPLPIPGIVAVKSDGTFRNYIDNSFTFATIKKFCQIEKFQLVEHVSTANAGEIARAELPVVLAIGNLKKEGDKFSDFLAKFNKEAFEIRSQYTDCLFGWIDSSEWANYVYKNWGVRQDDPLRIIFWSPADEKFAHFTEHFPETADASLYDEERLGRLGAFVTEIRRGTIELTETNNVKFTLLQMFRWFRILLEMGWESHTYAVVLIVSFPLLCCVFLCMFAERVHDDDEGETKDKKKKKERSKKTD
eukprot:Nk52_evm73s212 gene=Nk52_evmTU73s212